MARLRNVVTKIGPRGFRAVLFRMVPKLHLELLCYYTCFRAVLFRMVPKLPIATLTHSGRFRAVLFRMVPKQEDQ